MGFYRALLHLYPASFRAEYGDEMCEIFARRRHDASGFLAAGGLWIETFFDVLINALAVHWDILRQDLQYTWRTLARTPGFAITAVLVVALGVGANTAAFTVTDFVLVRPLPFHEPERLVKLWETTPGYTRMELSPANYRDWKRMSTSYDAMGAFVSSSVNLVGQGEPERLEATSVTADLFPVLGSQPAFGRLFTAADERYGAAGTVLLSHRLWQSVFGGDPGVIGRKVILDQGPYTVIGIMPRDFNFPDRQTELWTAQQFQEQDYQERDNNYLQVVARLKPGVSLAQSRAELNVIAGQLERQYPAENQHTGGAAILLHDEVSERSRLLLVALCGAAICVLLIACANLANLLLARGLVRQRELAVRAALGAGRERLVRQLVTESLVLAVAGGVLGMLVAFSALPLLTKLVPDSLPISQAPSVDLRVMAFAALITVLTGIGFGVVPARRACRADLRALWEGSRAGGGRREGLRSALVIVEIMASVALLVSSGLLMRALWRIQATDPGFRADGVLTINTALPMPKFEKTALRQEFFTKVLTGARALPGVSSAAYISFLPMVRVGGIWPVAITGQPLVRSESNTASMRFVTPGFFVTLGIPVQMGRDIAESDALGSPYVAVVSRSLVRRYWPNENPLGRHFQFAFHGRAVVGVVGDIRVRGLERPSEPQVYLPSQQMPDGEVIFYAPQNLVIRSTGTPAMLVPSIRQIVQGADREEPISDVRTLSEIVEEQTAPRSLQLRVLGAFATIAFLLAAIGIHGLLAFAVSQRSQEIGVRIALGARSGNILTMVLRQGMLLSVAGVLPGVALAYAAGRAMESLLAGVKPADTITFAAAVGLCLVMSLVGSLLPALRAVRVDPLTVIRSE